MKFIKVLVAAFRLLVHWPHSPVFYRAQQLFCHHKAPSTLIVNQAKMQQNVAMITALKTNVVSAVQFPNTLGKNIILAALNRITGAEIGKTTTGRMKARSVFCRAVTEASKCDKGKESEDCTS